MRKYLVILDASKEGSLALYTEHRQYVLDAETLHEAGLLAICDAFHEGLEHVHIAYAIEMTTDQQHTMILEGPAQ